MGFINFILETTTAVCIVLEYAALHLFWVYHRYNSGDLFFCEIICNMVKDLNILTYGKTFPMQ